MTLPVNIKLRKGFVGNTPLVGAAFITGANLILDGVPSAMFSLHVDNRSGLDGSQFNSKVIYNF